MRKKETNKQTIPEQGDYTSLPASASVLHNPQTLVVCQRLFRYHQQQQQQ